jgi:hypothetical protein
VNLSVDVYTEPVARATVTGILVSLVLASCTADPHGLTWGVSFASPDDQSRAVYVEAVIREGSCEGTERYRTLFPVAIGTTGDAPPLLDPGHYCLQGRARDGSCAWFVSGELEVDLPADQSPHVIPLSIPESSSECAMDECVMGRCSGEMIDAGMDATPDAPADGTPGDTITSVDGCLTAELCNGMDDDCDTLIDEGIDLMTDDRNCGSCGNNCSGDLTCISSSCECADGLTPDPPDRCRDLTTDPNNCGSLETECDNDEWCIGSSCECRPGLTMSGSSCVDTTSDPGNCGMVGNPCMGGEVCSDSTCVTVCMSGETLCGSACVDTDTNDLNCGTCGRTCDRGRLCRSGRCERYVVPMDCTECPCDCPRDYGCTTYGGTAVCYNRDD